MGNNTYTISKLTYDQLGRVNKKELYAYSILIDVVKYSYNIRGWVKGIDSGAFKETIYYEGAPGSIGKHYNGNIAAIAVKYPTLSNTTTGYIYSYDKMNRLIAGNSAEGEQLADNKNRDREYFSYDQNSNVVDHQNWGYRAGSYTLVQQVRATYEGNRLKTAVNSVLQSPTYNSQFMFTSGVTNSGGYKYVYDRNGNLVQDYNKGISRIEYNCLNLPNTIQMTNGNSIHYSYDALGRRQAKRTITLKAAVNVPMGEVYAATTDEIRMNRRMYYCGENIYAGGLNAIGLFRTLVPDGYIDGNGEWYYQIKDHLGSVRAEVDRGGVQYTTNYYPSGIQHGGHSLNDDYAFTGKELQTSHAVNLYDFEARYYDPIFGFTTMDPLCEKYYGVSPYSYCAGNPVNRIDPDGRETRVAINNDGTYRVIGGELNNDRNIYVYTQDKDGKYTIRGSSIGLTTSTTSFYNSDANNGEGAWAVGCIINPNDKSGDNFLASIILNNPAMFDDYIANAGNGGKYDFKVTNGTDKPINGIDIYRGMPIGQTANGQTVFSSARDIGNITAGYVAGANGMSWGASRIAFDAYQSKVSGKLDMEGLSTRNAEAYGWRMGSNIKNNTPTQKANNLLNSFRSMFIK